MIKKRQNRYWECSELRHLNRLIHLKSRFTSRNTSKTAFTLSEVLITLGIIGVVAAITLPALITNVQAKIRSEQIRTAKYKFTNATDKMKSLDLIGPYKNTESFINELKKHLKIAKICDSAHIEGCWPTTEVTINEDGETFKISKAKTGKSFNMLNDEENDYTSDNVGIVTADGTPMIISYNKKCQPLEPEKTYGWTTEDNKPVSNATAACVAAVMDINGSKKPNKLSEDVVLFNAMGLGSGCGMEIAGRCLSSPIASYTPLSRKECALMKDKLGMKSCAHPNLADNDYWGGAVKACGGVDKMPTQSDLAALARLLYNKNINADEAHYGLTYDNIKGSKLGLPTPRFSIWSGQGNDYTSSGWHYSPNSTSGSYHEGRSNIYLAVCILD